MTLPAMSGRNRNTLVDPSGNPILRALAKPKLFDSRGGLTQIGVGGVWADIFDLTGNLGRTFIGLEAYNADSTHACYISLCNARGAETRDIIVEPQGSIALDELTFGPSWTDYGSGIVVNYVRAMTPAAVGLPAIGTMTKAGNFTTGMIVNLGPNTYTFKTASLVTGNPAQDTQAITGGLNINVAIGTTLAASIVNLVAAINLYDFSSIAVATSGTVMTVTGNYVGLGLSANKTGNYYVFADGATPTSATFTGSGTLGGSGAAQVGTAGIILDVTVW